MPCEHEFWLSQSLIVHEVFSFENEKEREREEKERAKVTKNTARGVTRKHKHTPIGAVVRHMALGEREEDRRKVKRRLNVHWQHMHRVKCDLIIVHKEKSASRERERERKRLLPVFESLAFEFVEILLLLPLAFTCVPSFILGKETRGHKLNRQRHELKVSCKSYK